MKQLRAFLVADKWFNTPNFSEDMARFAASLAQVEFNDVNEEFGRLYEQQERAGANKWN